MNSNQKLKCEKISAWLGTSGGRVPDNCLEYPNTILSAVTSKIAL